MSLINDALKKAQKQRTGEAPTLASMPGVGGESAHRIARRAKPTGFNTLIMRAGIASAVALLVAFGAYFALRAKPSPGGPVSAPATVANGGSPLAVPSVASGEGRVGGPSAATTTASTQSSAPASEPAPTFTLRTDPTPPKVETPGVAKTLPSPPAVKRPDASSVASAKDGQPTTNNRQPVAIPEPAKPAVPAPKLEPKAIQFIENLKIGGVMARPTESKVLMNDRIYRVGATVEAEMGITLIEITTNTLTFGDERGGRYTRTF